MTTYCTRCGTPLPVPPPNPTCPNCADAANAAADTPTADANIPRWGIGPPALGILALAPTAILVSLLALTMPLAMATAISALTLGIVQIALAWALALRTWPPRLSPFGLTRPVRTPLKVATATIATIAASLTFAWFYGIATSALATQFGWNWLTPPELPAGLLLPGPALAASVLALVLWTPLAEEIFFRGFLMRGIANRWGLAPGLLASAAVFAILHLTPGVLLPVFVTGLLLGALSAYTRSLWPPIAVHAAQNALAVLATAANW